MSDANAPVLEKNFKALSGEAGLKSLRVLKPLLNMSVIAVERERHDAKLRMKLFLRRKL